MGMSRNKSFTYFVIPLGQTDQIRQLWYIRYIPRFSMVYQLFTTAGVLILIMKSDLYLDVGM